MEDSGILDLYFRRDESAIRETDAKYGRPLVSVSHGITGSAEDAEECLNDTYLATWRQIPPDRPEHFYFYLARIIRNLSYHRIRARTAEKRSANIVSLDRELFEMLPAREVEPMGEEELTKAIERFLTGEAPEMRYLFLRRYFWGDPIPALANLAGMSENAVSVRLSRIRKKLKRYLEREGYPV